jgi:outer membrane protein OmpU
MKHILASTALLALTTGFAAAEVTLSGDARMGIIGTGDDVYFTHRARVKFTLSGESDSGFSFGASFRAGNASDADDLFSYAGEVFISGAFGTLTMGDIDSAAQSTVGQVDGVGFTGLGDLNEILYVGGATATARYDYSSGGLSFSASVGQNGSNNHSVAAAYSMDGYKFSVGYEAGRGIVFGYTNIYLIEDHLILGADASFGDVTVKARYGMGSGFDVFFADADIDQLSLSATYNMDALSLTAFYAGTEATGLPTTSLSSDRYGLGVSYDLGGGAMLQGGYATESVVTCFGVCLDLGTVVEQWDLGLTFSF